jgi:hypothetical protein
MLHCYSTAGMTSLPKDKYDFDASGDESIFKRLLALTPLEIITQVAIVSAATNHTSV